ncbi:MAG: ThuA domain-containing protein [Planctomycetes bacterium]|nr:ThuA domain-containing protein [Planctomycetota bacterium]
MTHATTASPRQEGAAAGGLYLQDHGNPVRYRNVWVVERDPAKRRKVVFLAGGPSHGYGAHEHEAGCRLLAKALDESGLPIDTEVHVLWPEHEETLDTADVIVSFADGGGGHPLLRHMDVMRRQMARGASLVCIHYAVEVPTGEPGARFVDWLGGYFETHWSVNPMWTASFAALPDHPVARGVKPFAIHDEWYFHMRFRPDLESVTPILSAIAPASTMSREDGPHSGNPSVRAAVAAGEPQHVAWVRQRPDGGRAFGFTGAHVHWNWGHDDFRKVVLNAITWCAHLDVPEGGVPSTTPDLAALQANQSGEPGKNFDAAQLQQLLDSFRR